MGLIQPVILLRLAKWVPACWDEWAIWVSCVGVMTCSALCPIAQETALAGLMLCTEYGPNGWMKYSLKSTCSKSSQLLHNCFEKRLLQEYSSVVLKGEYWCPVKYSPFVHIPSDVPNGKILVKPRIFFHLSAFKPLFKLNYILEDCIKQIAFIILPRTMRYVNE